MVILHFEIRLLYAKFMKHVQNLQKAVETRMASFCSYRKEFMMGFKRVVGSRLVFKYQAAIENILLFKKG